MNFSSIKARFKKTNNSKSSGVAKEFIAKLSKGLMLPIAMLPIAGLFLGIGAAIVTNSNGNASLEMFGNFLKMPGDVIFGALPVLFAIAIAIAFTKDAGAAALSAFVGFLVFSGLQQALIEPVKDSSGAIFGYNLLFYSGDILGQFSPSINEGGTIINAGLDKSIFGTVLGINQLSTSVFGGFLVGFTVSFLYNKFKDIQLPAIIGFFSGVRFIPIVVFFSFIPITLLMLILWPLVGILFNIIGGGLGSNMLGFQSFIFGFIERALVPFGLHHAFYSPLWYSSVGGQLNLNDIASINGQFIDINSDGTPDTWLAVAQSFGYNDASTSIAGDQVMWAFTNSWLAGREITFLDGTKGTVVFSDLTTNVYRNSLELAFKNNPGTSVSKDIGSAGVNIGQYMQGKYPFMMFGLPAAAAAMVMAAPKENRKMSLSIVGSAGLTSMLTGITEPIEFTFLFLTPWLFWGFHAFFCAISFGLMNWIGLIIPSVAPHIGMTFSGGLIDWVIYGALQIDGGSNAWWSLIFGVGYIPIYFFFFLFAIKRFNIETPGRGGNTKLYTKADYKNKNDNNATNNLNSNFDPLAVEVIKAYGGLENIKNVDACITKLRIQVVEQDKVDENRLKNELGAMGTIRPSSTSVYSIYGAKADYLKVKIIEIIKATHNDQNLKEQLFSSTNSIDIKNNLVDDKKNNFSNTKEKFVIYSPVDGELLNMEDVPDETFSKNIMGFGIAIKPSSNHFGSLLKEGKTEVAFDGGHAYIFSTNENSQVMMHIGIDSVNLKDENNKSLSTFKPFVKNGDLIDNKSKIVDVNLDILNKYAKSSITPIIVLNETLNNREIKIIPENPIVKKGDPILMIE
ncbi:MAG: glucose PTS transporter subunit IIA [Metamycoplasmataceae bacterium]